MSGKSIIVMGVSGSGKSTIGINLAREMNAKFIDGDDLHPKDNILKMASGNPLNDEDRGPWLKRINDAIFSLDSKGEEGIIACSALKKEYRDIIREGNRRVIFLFLDGTKELIIERMSDREGHFMKEEMINSQFDTLQRPVDEPDTIVISIDDTVDNIVDNAINAFGLICD